MKFESSVMLLAMMGVASARPDAVRMGATNPSQLSARSVKFQKLRREVPQEHSHEKIVSSVRTSLNLNNAQKVSDPVFSLLGDAAAAKGAGDITNLACFQQDVADQAFTNAKAANDVNAMADALIFRAIERNTAGVGTKSALCQETAKNPEVAALTQHQDPASAGAAATNKQIALNLAVQLNSIGADPQRALESGTFAPGDPNDKTGAGKTCDDANDKQGCIFTQNLLVNDATADEIKAAVAAGGAGAGAGAGTATKSGSAAASCAASPSGAASSSSPASASSAASVKTNAAATGNTASSGATASTSGTNVNAFTGSTGSAPVPIQSSAGDRPFSVNGDSFVGIGAAIQRACDVQKNKCANSVNTGGSGSVSDCDAQQQQCVAANGKKRRRAAADTGSCGSPAIKFAAGLDGRKEASFAPVNSADFNHGSALKPGVVTQFICQQLQSKCKAAQATVDACNQGVTASNAATGQAAADAFNAALGV